MPPFEEVQPSGSSRRTNELSPLRKTLRTERRAPAGPSEESSVTEPETPDRSGSVVEVPIGHVPHATERGLYVYCIVECAEPRSFGRVGIGDRSEAYTINFRDLAAVVSD